MRKIRVRSPKSPSVESTGDPVVDPMEHFLRSTLRNHFELIALRRQASSPDRERMHSASAQINDVVRIVEESLSLIGAKETATQSETIPAADVLDTSIQHLEHAVSHLLQHVFRAKAENVRKSSQTCLTFACHAAVQASESKA